MDNLRTDKEQVIILYPDAKCKAEKSKVRGAEIHWIICNNTKQLGNSYISEEQAWNWALAGINNAILRKFQGFND